MFHFAPRWKETLDVSGPGGRFCLYLPMGVLTVCLPDERRWQHVAPSWAAALWPVLKAELEVWCKANAAELDISPTAAVWLET